MRTPLIAIAGALAVASAAGFAAPASARTFVSVGIGAPAYPAYYGYPGYYAPPVAVGFGGYWGRPYWGHPYWGWRGRPYGWRRPYWGGPGWPRRW